MRSMHEDIQSILLTQEEIAGKVAELSVRINRDYEGKQPMLIGVLKGSFVFMADLIRRIEHYCNIDFMAVSTYGNQTVTTGAVQIDKDLSQDIEGRDILIIEDILDSGVTLNYLKGYLTNRRPSSLRICTLLDKPDRRKADIAADYSGFVIPDAFVVGYGLDYAERYRNLPYIGVLKPEIYNG